VTVHVGELSSEVVPDAGAAPAAAPASGDDEARQALADQAIRDAARTRAEGFDD
jgi:hypothetical protein